MARVTCESMAERELRTRFKLTPAEARVALGIYRGETLAAIALTYGISVQTARTQLKSIFTKTGTHRQTQLAVLLSKTLAEISK